MSALKINLEEHFPTLISTCIEALGEVTVEVARDKLIELCTQLRDHKDFQFEVLIDVCGVDYQDYGVAEWATDETTTTGFSRGVEGTDARQQIISWDKPRFGVVYHLLSVKHNHRIRLRTFAEDETPIVPSVVGLWDAANWFEREAFDMFGILFDGHPDLRRILTDYGFIGHPFRKDFPVSGNVEMRYDAKQARVIYEPVQIEPRTLVPRVIRDDSRYEIVEEELKEASNG